MSDRHKEDSSKSTCTAEKRRAHAKLQVWLSPSFPVGAFAYSHGLEKAIELGWIKDRSTLQEWLADLVAVGSLRNDLILLAETWRACRTNSRSGLIAVSELSVALQPSAERHTETTQQGGSFLNQIATAWPADREAWDQLIDGIVVTYPIAVGIASSAHNLPLGDVVMAYAIAFVGNITSAGIRLSVIGQSDAQQIASAFLDRLIEAARAGEYSSLTDLGGATWRSDIASMLHETQTTRLFRS